MASRSARTAPCTARPTEGTQAEGQFSGWNCLLRRPGLLQTSVIKGVGVAAKNLGGARNFGAVLGFASIFLLKTNRVSKEKQPPVANPSTPQASNRWIVFKTLVSWFWDSQPAEKLGLG